ncbi:hypothetical protein RHSIM_Rhsim01G0099000 [Rhododendron simsii]|uniref:TF-B3 domain-containing protein n=1 Tax=Rhododendron simsii TaxID=118357 RepID=A0A834HLL0_RHOSS|nr:hypothetical protein RHSIM_Rhsim01G0099000 [Rhododendron simsii]
MMKGLIAGRVLPPFAIWLEEIRAMARHFTGIEPEPRISAESIELLDTQKLSRPFFDLHMPGHNASCVLVDASDQEEYRIKYLVAKSLLSGGWRAFSIAHRLLEGDVLIF